jgi:hypothetical protein
MAAPDKGTIEPIVSYLSDFFLSTILPPAILLQLYSQNSGLWIQMNLYPNPDGPSLLSVPLEESLLKQRYLVLITIMQKTYSIIY